MAKQDDREQRRIQTTRERHGEKCFSKYGKKGGNPVLRAMKGKKWNMFKPL